MTTAKKQPQVTIKQIVSLMKHMQANGIARLQWGDVTLEAGPKQLQSAIAPKQASAQPIQQNLTAIIEADEEFQKFQLGLLPLR